LEFPHNAPAFQSDPHIFEAACSTMRRRQSFNPLQHERGARRSRVSTAFRSLVRIRVTMLARFVIMIIDR